MRFFSYKKVISYKKNVLSLEITGDIKDVERLKRFFEMFKETLVQLPA